MEEENPIKDILYEILEKIGEENIQSQISKKKTLQIIEKVLSECHPRVMNLKGNKIENTAGLATSILHYFLTICLIPSQRKIDYDGREIDIIIPDFRSLKNSPQNSLVIIIPKTDSAKDIEKNIQELARIQPNPNNIWVVSDRSKINHKTYGIKSEELFRLLTDVNDYLKSRKKTQFKIFKS